jgi:hypothetical protein
LGFIGAVTGLEVPNAAVLRIDPTRANRAGGAAQFAGHGI